MPKFFALCLAFLFFAPLTTARAETLEQVFDPHELGYYDMSAIPRYNMLFDFAPLLFSSADAQAEIRQGSTLYNEYTESRGQNYRALELAYTHFAKAYELESEALYAYAPKAFCARVQLDHFVNNNFDMVYGAAEKLYNIYHAEYQRNPKDATAARGMLTARIAQAYRTDVREDRLETLEQIVKQLPAACEASRLPLPSALDLVGSKYVSDEKLVQREKKVFLYKYIPLLTAEYLDNKAAIYEPLIYLELADSNTDKQQEFLNKAKQLYDKQYSGWLHLEQARELVHLHGRLQNEQCAKFALEQAQIVLPRSKKDFPYPGSADMLLGGVLVVQACDLSGDERDALLKEAALLFSSCSKQRFASTQKQDVAHIFEQTEAKLGADVGYKVAKSIFESIPEQN